MMAWLRRLLGPSEREVFLEIARLHAESERANSEVLKEWLGMFKASTQSPPAGWLADDEHVAARELARSKGVDLPIELTSGDEVSRAQWVADMIDRDE